MQELILSYLPLFRLGLFLCCLSCWALGYHWLAPRGREVPAAIMAAWTQFSIGVLLDILIVRWGFWVYRPMELSLMGVPLDLHLNWALIWGFFLPWIYSRLLRSRFQFSKSSRSFLLLYLVAWTIGTVLLDALAAPNLLFLQRISPQWWVVDALFLFIVQGVTLWIYHSILFPSPSPFWRRWSCRIRSLIYVSSLAYLFYGYLPSIVLSLTDGWSVRPLLRLDDWRILALLLVPPIALGTRAALIFADEGSGTPLPLDPPLRLVRSGPYAFVRNPMQISGLLLAIVLVLYYPTSYMLIYTLNMALTSIVLINLFEHHQMQQTFQATYDSYAREIRNWVPRFHTIL